jgi:hypothetical protein
MSLDRFCPTSPDFHGYITTFMSFLPYNKVYALVSSNVKQSQLIVEQG